MYAQHGKFTTKKTKKNKIRAAEHKKDGKP
jgi:hypothetical protein